MYKAVDAAKLCVHPMFNRAFIVLLCKQFRLLTPEQLADDDGLADHAKECLQTIEEMCGCEPLERPQPIESDDIERQYLVTVKETIESILKAARTFDEKRKADIGPLSYDVSFEKLASDAVRGRDYDAMLSAIKQVRGLDLESTLIRNDKVYEMLEDLVGFISKFLISEQD